MSAMHAAASRIVTFRTEERSLPRRARRESDGGVSRVSLFFCLPPRRRGYFFLSFLASEEPRTRPGHSIPLIVSQNRTHLTLDIRRKRSGKRGGQMIAVSVNENIADHSRAFLAVAEEMR